MHSASTHKHAQSISVSDNLPAQSLVLSIKTFLTVLMEHHLYLNPAFAMIGNRSWKCAQNEQGQYLSSNINASSALAAAMARARSSTPINSLLLYRARNPEETLLVLLVLLPAYPPLGESLICD